MQPYLNKTDFDRYFKYLQLLTINEHPDSLEQWIFHKARTSYIDIYDITINKGDTYYVRTLRNKELKLSYQSMDKYLFLLFEDTIELQNRCEYLMEQRKQQISEGKSKVDW